MPPQDLVPLIHAAPLRGVLAVTGGGSESLPALLTVPGASATVLEAVVPYSAASLADWLGEPPAQACSESTARQLARRARQRAGALAPGADPFELFGLGATAALATSRPRRGEHRAHVAVETAARTVRLTLRFEKGRRSRAEEEAATAHAIVAALAHAAGVRAIDLTRTPPGVEAELDDFVAPTGWAELLLGRRQAVPLGGAPAPGAGAVCLLPGSFNPPHAGHAGIAKVAAERTGRPVVYELAVENVDKPPLDLIELRDRVAALHGAPMWLTRTPRFVEKAHLAPGAVFAVGADTIARIGDARYYAGSAARDAALAELAELGCRFLVFGRVDGGRFVTTGGLSLPPALASLCDAVPEADFREDVSSTALRTRGGDSSEG
ncbi:CinA family protein [Botrimarina sp.]|uniref:CinA family protein n=1 Tax=Botrimarina sp. TaxID=2795802 RepID=UPI0032EF2525